MTGRCSTTWSYAIFAVTYLALMVIYLAAGRYGYAAIWLVFAAGWAVLARLATKTPTAKRAVADVQTALDREETDRD